MIHYLNENRILTKYKYHNLPTSLNIQKEHSVICNNFLVVTVHHTKIIIAYPILHVLQKFDELRNKVNFNNFTLR